MLVNYKKSCAKIAMGLLSLMPKERDLKRLQLTMRTYEENPNWQLYFWKKGDAYVGVAGVEIGKDHYTIRHLSVDPSHRGEGIGHEMVESIQRLMGHRSMRATPETRAFLDTCPQRRRPVS